MIITSKEKYEDREVLRIDYNNAFYICDRFNEKSKRPEGKLIVWWVYESPASYRYATNEEVEELEKELKKYYRNKKLERL